MPPLIESQKGGHKLAHEGYMYVKNSATSDKVYWTCEKKRVPYYKCPARAITTTMDGQICVVKSSDHNHAPSTTSIGANELVNKMKQRSRTSKDKPATIIQDITSEATLETIIEMPSKEALRKRIQRARKNNQSGSTLSEDQKLTLAGQKFLLSEIVEDNDKYLIFGTIKNIELMYRSDFWIMDGTFKVVPKDFQQICSIHCVFSSGSKKMTFPFVYILMTSRSEASYTKVFSAIFNIARDNGFLLEPSCIMTDFEMAAINASKKVFSPLAHKCCLFHLSQSVWRNVQAKSLVERYTNDDFFALNVKMMVSMAFLEPSEIYLAFDMIKERLDCNEFSEWFDSFYVNGKINRYRTNGTAIRVPPRFPPALWSISDFADREWPRTQNSIEAWHSRFNGLLNCSHASLGRLVDELRKEQHTTEAAFESFLSGRLPPTRAKDERKEENIRRILRNKDVYSMEEFLEVCRGILPYNHVNPLKKP